MHHWGDNWPHGNELHEAIHFSHRWFQWLGIGSNGKEKYGTFRHHMNFYSGWWPVHELLKPGHAFYRWHRRWMLLEVNVLSPLVRYSGLAWIVRKVQLYRYNAILQTACKRYPNVVEELIVDSEVPEAIKPGIWGRVDGQRIQES